MSGDCDPFPVSDLHDKVVGTIPIWLARLAYESYTCKQEQSLEEIGRRGGFGRGEIVALIRGDYGHAAIHKAIADIEALP